MILIKSKEKTTLDINTKKIEVSYADIVNYKIIYSKSLYKEENEFTNYFLKLFKIENIMIFNVYIKDYNLYLTIPSGTLRKIKIYQLTNQT